MVDAPKQSPDSGPTEKPFAMKAVVFTIGFLVFILGVVPSLFYWAGEAPGSGLGFWSHIRNFWFGLRSLVGVGVFAIGFSAYLFCSVWLIAFGKGPHVEFDPPKVFVATGPYRWVRNPVVLTLLVTVLGEAIFLGSWGVFILVLLGLPFAHYQVTRIEEPRLRERFGESYIDYCHRVSRWIPRRPQDD